jgi:hypothetical protein
MKYNRYYYIWIEGLSGKGGEKVCQLDDTGYTITTKMSDAMRVKPEQIHLIKAYLKRHGVADWCLESAETFIPISYAPAGTILNTKGWN